MLNKNIILEAIDASRDGLIITESQGKDNPIVYVNPAFEALTGFDQAEMLGKDCRFLQGTNMDQPEIKKIRKAIKNKTPIRIILRNYKKDGALFWNELSISPVNNDSGITTHFVGIQKDVTREIELTKKLAKTNERLKLLNKQLEKENKIDGLTGLFNRNVLTHEAEILWSGTKRTNSLFTVFFIDIDHFKVINDTYGHHAGDLCLKNVADILKQRCVRRSDIIIRQGGDEFLVLSAGMEPATALSFSGDLLDAISHAEIKIKEPEITIKITASIGCVSEKYQAEQTIDSFLDAADAAMYKAKIAGRNRVMLGAVPYSDVITL